MNKERLETFINRYHRIAKRAYFNYQDSGVSRYYTTYNNNEEIAEALEIALSAEEDHNKLLDLRSLLSELATKAERAQIRGDNYDPAEMRKILQQIIVAAKARGLHD